VEVLCDKIKKTHKLVNVRHPKSDENVLHYALSHGMKDFAKQLINFEIGSELLTSSHHIKQSGISGRKNCLHIATEMDDSDMVRFILDKIPNSNTRLECMKLETAVDIQGQRPRLFSCLHLAAYFGNTELVRLFLDRGMDVNHLNGKKDTALLWAARWGHDETVSVLLQRGADPEVKNDKGSTALYWAIRYQFPSTVSLLLTKGRANPNTSRKLGLVAPIIIASAYGNALIVDELLKCPGIDVNMKIRGGDTAIHNAAREGWLKVVKMLINAGARFDESDDLGDTPLLLAAKNGHVDVAQHLMKRFADVNHKNHDGYDVWYYAIDNESNALLKALVARKQNVEELKRNPLCIAASVGKCDKIKLLLGMNFDPKSTDDEGNTFLHHAAMFDQAEVIDTFHSTGVLHAKNETGNTPLHLACLKGLTKSINSLLNCKAKADIKNNKGETPLHVAAYSADISAETAKTLVQYTIKTHAWESLHDKDIEGNNCLHIAGKFASPEVLWEFRFVRLNDKDKDGLTPLHEAVRPGQEEALEIMLDIFETMKRDASINEPSYQTRETVLHLAADEGHARSVKRLIDLGADIAAKDADGDTVLHRLVKAIVFDEKHKSRHIEVFDVILDNIVKWWCLRTSQQLPARAKDIKAVTYRRNAVLYIINDVINNEGLSVLNQAFKSGCPEVLHRLTLMPGVTMIEYSSHMYSFDISGMTPRTNNELKGCSKIQVSPAEDVLAGNADDTSISGLELLITNNAMNAAEILDLPPIRNIERYYTSMVAWTFVILMVFHIVYMSLFTYLSVEILKKLRTDESQINSSDTQTLFLYIVAPLEPAIIIIYNMYALVRYYITGDVSKKSKLSRKQGAGLVLQVIASYLFQVVCVGFAALVFVWIGLFTQRYSYQDYVLAAVICTGWLLTISFTRGIRAIHYFYRMLLSMIIRDVLRFIIVYLFVLMAFAFTFHVLFQVSADISENYESPFDTMFLTFNMMIGMGELFDDSFETGMTAVGRTTTYVKVIYLLYMILGTIVLLNLLIAMMNDSYSQILAQKQVTWRIDSVRMGVEIESSFPLSRIFSTVKIQHGSKYILIHLYFKQTFFFIKY
jgi:ankyrin repeat protein